MATTKIPTIYGSKPSKLVPKQLHYRRSLNRVNRRSLDKGFIRYHFEDEAFPDFYPDGGDSPDPVSEFGTNDCNNSQQFSSQFQVFPINRNAESSQTSIFTAGHSKRRCMTHPKLEIFCSKWLTNDQIVMGTKCNQLLLYNVKSHKVDYIPILCLPKEEESPPTDQCGIHSLELNPSRTLMATGAQNSNEVAVYSLPTLDPVCMGEGAHSDWIFDLCWLDDQFLVSASRDKSLAIWKVDDALCRKSYSPNYSCIQPLSIQKCCGADKVRAVIFNPNYLEIVALSLNAKLHVYDATIFKQVMSQKLEVVNENVCMTKTDNCSMYAVGSKSHVTLIDPRTLQSINKIDTRKNGPNIRSLSFRGSVLTIGTGIGDILFYDVRAGRYLERDDGVIDLKCSKCEVCLDESSSSLQSHFETALSDSAIYTHCYDWSGTRLFAAGGPLSASFKGCYASLWC